MIGSPTAIQGFSAPTAARAEGRHEVAFADVMRRARGGATEEDVREAAEDLVANAFLAPVLRQIRESSDAAPPFQPTPAEKQFGQLLDIETARQIVRKSELPIVERLTETFERLRARQDETGGGLGAEGVVA